MGEAQGTLFEPQFNRSVKVQTTDHRITSNAGVVLLREAEHRFGLISAIAGNIEDPRRPDRIRYTIDELIRERVFAMALDKSKRDSTLFRAVWLDQLGGRTRAIDFSMHPRTARQSRTP